MKTILNKFQTTLMLLFSAILIVSCESEMEEGLVTNVSVNVSSFKVNGIAGEIDNQNDKITVTLPYGTAVNAVTPTIEIPQGAVISPASGTVQNFTQPIKYRVKNGNIYKDYQVTVQAQVPIISFKINDKRLYLNN